MVAQTTDFILGPPFLFAFQVALLYNATWMEEILGVVDSHGSWFQLTICQPMIWDLEPRERLRRREEANIKIANCGGPLGRGGF